MAIVLHTYMCACRGIRVLEVCNYYIVYNTIIYIQFMAVFSFGVWHLYIVFDLQW